VALLVLLPVLVWLVYAQKLLPVDDLCALATRLYYQSMKMVSGSRENVDRVI
jgi:hypothetical protein